MLDTSAVGLTRVDKQWRYLSANPAYARIVGMRVEEIVGRSVAEILGPAAAEKIRPHIERVLAGEVVEYEIELPLAVAGTRWVHFNYTPWQAPDGSIAGWVASVEDISARKHAEAVLRETQASYRAAIEQQNVRLIDRDRRKDEFLATLSHELRNPLAPIRTAAQILASQNLESQQIQWVQQVLTRQTQHLARLLDDLLDMSRITQGKLALRRQRVSLSTIADTAVEATRARIDAKKHTLVMNLPAELPELEGDPVRLAQILSNLLTNAAKFTDVGGRIEVTAAVEGSTLCLTVKDTGIGLSTDVTSSIFTMFTQIPGSSGRAEGGLGIGLALVKGLVELHGGSVEAHSDGIGHGSAFIVRLPLAAPVPTPITPDRDRLASKRSALKVLIADDNEDAAEALAMLMRLKGHEVRVARDGTEAVLIAHVFRPQLALLDLAMPTMSGYEAARLIRQESWTSALTLVALSGWGQERDKERAIAAGFDHHLTKPIDYQQLEMLLSEMETQLLTPAPEAHSGPG